MSDGDKPRVGDEERSRVIDMLLSGTSIRKVASDPSVNRNKETVHRISRAFTDELLKGAKKFERTSQEGDGRRVSLVKRIASAFLNDDERDELLNELLLSKSVKQRKRHILLENFKVSKSTEGRV